MKTNEKIKMVCFHPKVGNTWNFMTIKKKKIPVGACFHACVHGLYFLHLVTSKLTSVFDDLHNMSHSLGSTTFFFSFYISSQHKHMLILSPNYHPYHLLLSTIISK